MPRRLPCWPNWTQSGVPPRARHSACSVYSLQRILKGGIEIEKSPAEIHLDERLAYIKFVVDRAADLSAKSEYLAMWAAARARYGAAADDKPVSPEVARYRAEVAPVIFRAVVARELLESSDAARLSELASSAALSALQDAFPDLERRLADRLGPVQGKLLHAMLCDLRTLVYEGGRLPLLAHELNIGGVAGGLSPAKLWRALERLADLGVIQVHARICLDDVAKLVTGGQVDGFNEFEFRAQTIARPYDVPDRGEVDGAVNP